MKTKAKIKKGFKPVTLKITFERQEEMDIFGSLFNVTHVCDFLRSKGISPEDIREALKSNGAEISGIRQWLDLFKAD